MSRQNKVNPGMYTQRGRLTQDDAARELAKQRSIGSDHTWQPGKRAQQPRPTAKAAGADDDAADAEPVARPEEKPARVIANARPARVVAKPKPAAQATTKSKTKAPRGARKAVPARGAGKGSALLAAGRKKKQSAHNS